MTSSGLSSADTSVKLNDFERLWAAAGSSVLEAVRVVGESGWYILGHEVEAFERELAAYWKQGFAVGLASGLDAVEIGLRCCGCGPGDKVLLPPVSAFATALAVIKIGAIPVFCDCDRFGLLDLSLAEEALSADPAIGFMVPVHLYGHCLDISHLRRLKESLGLRIVEDCAQSIGASHRGVESGLGGDCAATSFYPTKNLGAFGDGGALLTSSYEIASQAKVLRNYGQSARYRHDTVGYNSRLDELHAAILRRVFLPRLSIATQQRRAIANEYLSKIGNSLVQPLGAPQGSESCWHLFPVRVPQGRKQDFTAHLRARDIQSAEHYPVAMMDQPAMRGVKFEQFGSCEVGRELCAREISLPIHPFLTPAEVGRVVDACNTWS
jgi:dTDP-4-amino-4,6-dideoxygalactose transaminase